MPKIKRKYVNSFTTVSNAFLNDPKLGLLERGLLITMLSLPDNWEFSGRGLAAILPDGRDRVYKTLNGLEERGYLKRTKITVKGKIVDYLYEFCDTPIFLDHRNNDNQENVSSCKKALKKGSSDITSPCPENPYTGNQDDNKYKKLSDTNSEKSEIFQTDSPASGNVAFCTHSVETDTLPPLASALKKPNNLSLLTEVDANENSVHSEYEKAIEALYVRSGTAKTTKNTNKASVQVQSDKNSIVTKNGSNDNYLTHSNSVDDVTFSANFLQPSQDPSFDEGFMQDYIPEPTSSEFAAIHDADAMKDFVKERVVMYDYCIEKLNISRNDIDFVVDTLVEMLTSKNRQWIGGHRVGIRQVRDKVSKLNAERVADILEKVRRKNDGIGNYRQYLKAALLNSSGAVIAREEIELDDSFSAKNSVYKRNIDEDEERNLWDFDLVFVKDWDVENKKDGYVSGESADCMTE